MTKSKSRSSGAVTNKSSANGANTKKKAARDKAIAKRLLERRIVLNKVAEEVCYYLRVRRNIDGVFLYMNKPFQYKSREFKRLFMVMILNQQGNYFGVSFNSKGIITDTIFTDFYLEYSAKDKDYWNKNIGAFKNLIKRYVQTYKRRGADKGGHTSSEYYRWIYHRHATDMTKTITEEDEDNFNFLDATSDERTDYLFKHRRKLYQANFTWEKMSRKKSKRKRRREAENSRAKCWQSLRAFDALTNANNVTLDDRFILLASSNSDVIESKATMMVVDTHLEREHHFIMTASNSTRKQNSVYTGIIQAANILEGMGNVDFKNGTITLPSFQDNTRADAYKHPQVLDLRGGGYIDGGCPHGDSSAAELGSGEFVLTQKAVTALGKGSNELGAKILSSVMRMLESQWHKYR